MRDPPRWKALALVEALHLPQGCMGAGFVCNLVWDHLHGQTRDCREEDLDVLYYDPSVTDPGFDAEIEENLRASAPDFDWSVKNQARMHLRNNDAPYTSVEDAMRFWPETATAVAATRSGSNCNLIAPFGLHDLDNLILRPTSAMPRKIAAFHKRIRTKNWRERWPNLQLIPDSDLI